MFEKHFWHFFVFYCFGYKNYFYKDYGGRDYVSNRK